VNLVGFTTKYRNDINDCVQCYLMPPATNLCTFFSMPDSPTGMIQSFILNFCNVCYLAWKGVLGPSCKLHHRGNMNGKQYQKTGTIELYFTSVKVKITGRWHWGRNAGWGCLRIGCWGEYLDLRRTRRMRCVGHVARMGEDRGVHRCWWGSLRERGHWGDQDVDGRIILRWIFRKFRGVGSWGLDGVGSG
jgi:hypothetical protein